MQRFFPLWIPQVSSLGHSLMAAVYSFSLHGVIHNDMRSGNILILPNRIVLIDFGQAILRSDIEDDKHWAKRKRKLRLSAGYRIIAKYATALPTSLRNYSVVFTISITACQSSESRGVNAGMIK
jgi:serine/threonine protein kinase